MKKRILIVCNSKFVYNKFIKETKIYFQKKKILVDILSGEKITDNNDFYYIKMPTTSYLSYFRFILAPIQIYQLLAKKRYSAIIHNNRNASICSRLAVFFYFKKIKSIYFSRGMYFHDNQNIISYYLSFLIEIFFLLKTDLILSQNKEDLNKTSIFAKFLSVRSHYIGNGVDIKKFKKIKKVFNFKKKINICTICRFSKGKGLESILDVYFDLKKKYSNCFLTIIGGPRSYEDQIYFNKIFNKYQLNNFSKNVYITGLQKNVSKFLKANEIYVHPSKREGMPRSLIEAMSSGLLCISNNVRGSRELIQNNKNGFIYNNKNELYLTLQKIIKMTCIDILKITDKSTFLIKKNFNQEKYLNLQYKHVKKLL